MKANGVSRPLEGGRGYVLLTSALVIGFVAGVVYNQKTGTGVYTPVNCNEPFRPAVQALGRSQAACTPKVTTQYFSSAQEQSWLENAAKWEKYYCKAIATPTQERAVKVWTETLRKAQSSAASSSSSNSSNDILWDPAIFSRFQTTVTCGPSSQTFVTWIEPLSHGLRHPNSLCRPHDTKAALLDMSYLLLEQQANVNALRTAANQSCLGRTCLAIYVDLGATVWSNIDGVTNMQDAGQGWFVRHYEKQGITFDRLLLWEARPINPPSKIYQQLPLTLLHKYQYFNMPATTNLSLPSHPLRVIKDIAQPGDFVVLKLNIDNSAVEMSILNAFLQDDEAFSLVDEFYFEHHVDFGPMRRHWMKTVDPNASLSDSYQLFLKLRQKGWRAHAWV